MWIRKERAGLHGDDCPPASHVARALWTQIEGVTGPTVMCRPFLSHKLYYNSLDSGVCRVIISPQQDSVNHNNRLFPPFFLALYLLT